MIDQPHALSLAGITPKDFLRTYWQKQPLLIRQAFPNFTGLLSPGELIELACQEDAQSRLVIQRNKKWHLKHGPFRQAELARLPQKNWTLLVQDINHFLSSARDLLTQFRFIPHARLDDVMVSYAPIGGGVGPHFDSYDVFLLQGMGSRRWQISSQQDQQIIADAPLKILLNFQPEQEWILEPGDMLYLPPRYAHNGIAEEGDCMTYSIGFRAPSHQELITQFLVYLQDHLEIEEGWYSDPDLQLQSHPSLISQALHTKVSAILEKLKWNHEDIENFLGVYLSEPKSHVFFDQPSHPLPEVIFLQQAKENGIQLNLKSRLLSGNRTLYINGESYEVNPICYKELVKLADDHELPVFFDMCEESKRILYNWYVSGYLNIKMTSK
ncbi:cupin domain-containing protein [Nitrosomonas sp. JL21]|uniref:cupin domain-containing protein n=1 Tax=Nitrosomonas sp. JL21 TaxID=153949 RepID=UPI00136C2139|nr:cupin domain-containing protein [Nitrosomonas sp. JL21]MBL8497690.1 cupin domain-containing protein [Nitrosomonas sp.]MXS78366.1 cupin domain-containing protein [Nitrosomonas sp. JL21]